jgi:WhiB family redox-sensing transcriptional regulator
VVTSDFADAPCRREDPDMFFPHPGDVAGTARAKRVCAGCALTRECLELGRKEEWGIWGGLTAKERAGKRRAVRRCATA